MSSDAASYQLVRHQTVDFDSLPWPECDLLPELLEEVARHEQPTSHPDCKTLTDTHAGLLSVRSGQYRAVCELDKPEIRILAAGHRDTIYDKHDAIQRRASDA